MTFISLTLDQSSAEEGICFKNFTVTRSGGHPETETLTDKLISRSSENAPATSNVGVVNQHLLAAASRRHLYLKLHSS